VDEISKTGSRRQIVKFRISPSSADNVPTTYTATPDSRNVFINEICLPTTIIACRKFSAHWMENLLRSEEARSEAIRWKSLSSRQEVARIR
jgi:hypothetical protein